MPTAPPETPEAARSTNKRERILRSAVEVFARTGYFNAKVSEIAREASVADGTIYLYFEGKEDLLLTIFRENTRGYLSDLRDELAGLDRAADRIRLAIRFQLERLGADRALAVVFQVELRQSLKFMSRLSQEEVADYLNLLRTIVEQGQKESIFRSEIHPQLAAKAIFGILDEMVTSWILSEKEYRLEDQADQIADFVLHGLQ